MQKSTMLKVVGILLIIFGALSLIGGILILAGSSVLGAAAANKEVTGILMVASIITIIAGAFNLFAGIMGVKNCASPEKAQVCVTIGIIMIAIQVVSIIINIVSDSFAITSLFGLLLPILYFIGANQLKKAQ